MRGSQLLARSPDLRSDATITLFSHHLAGSQLQGLPRWAVVEMVVRAVRAVPGARWIDVEVAGGTLPEAIRHPSPLDRLYAVGNGVAPGGIECDALRQCVKAAIAGTQVR